MSAFYSLSPKLSAEQSSKAWSVSQKNKKCISSPLLNYECTTSKIEYYISTMLSQHTYFFHFRDLAADSYFFTSACKEWIYI